MRLFIRSIQSNNAIQILSDNALEMLYAKPTLTIYLEGESVLEKKKSRLSVSRYFSCCTDSYGLNFKEAIGILHNSFLNQSLTNFWQVCISSVYEGNNKKTIKLSKVKETIIQYLPFKHKLLKRTKKKKTNEKTKIP